MNNQDFWTAPGPQITDPEYGPEPSLFEMMVYYYQGLGGCSKEQATKHAMEYIEARQFSKGE